MKPKNILMNGLGIFLICFAVACGGGSSKDQSMSEAKEETEGASSEDRVMANEKSMIKDEMPETEAAAVEEEATEADAGYDQNSPFDNKKSETDLTKVFSSSIAMVDEEDTIHKFIRTGDIRFKVKHVSDATYRIEDITRKFKGFVTYTTLNSRVDRQTTRVVSKDSILKTTYFTVENTITIRVPVKNLDTTLKEISQLVEYLDYRNLTANDVRLQILSNKLEKRRLARYNARLSKISDQGGANYMDDKAYIEENLLQKQAEEDQTLIDDLSLEDQIEYSTITLSIYQDEEIVNELIANEENIEDYKPSLGSRILESLKEGWYFIEDFMVGLIAAWPLLMIIFIVYLVLRKNGYLSRKKSEESKNENGGNNHEIKG